MIDDKFRKKIYQPPEPNNPPCSSSAGAYGACRPPPQLGIAGVSIVLSNESWWLRRIVWTVVLLMSFTALGLQLYEFFSRFVANKIHRTLTYKELDEIPLPAITVCHGNMFKPSVIEEMMVANHTLEDWYRSPRFALIDWGRFNIDQFVTRASYTWREMISGCWVAYDNCEQAGTFKTALMSRSMGLCHTYNTEKLVRESMMEASIGMSFADNFWHPSYDRHRGWVIFFHAQDVIFTDTIASADLLQMLRVPANTSLDVRVTIRAFSSLPQGNKGSDYACHAQNATKTIKCVEDCLYKFSNITSDTCHVPWNRRLPGQRSCSTFEELSAMIRNDFFIHIYQTSSIDELMIKCKCTLPCEYSFFSLSTPYRQPTAEAWDHYGGDPNVPARGQLKIWMRSVAEVITESRPYQLTEFSSDVGGSLGLMIGGSLLSVMEILDCVCCLMVNLVNSRRQQRQLTPGQ